MSDIIKFPFSITPVGIHGFPADLMPGKAAATNMVEKAKEPQKILRKVNNSLGNAALKFFEEIDTPGFYFKNFKAVVDRHNANWHRVLDGYKDKINVKNFLDHFLIKINQLQELRNEAKKKLKDSKQNIK